MRGQLNKFCTKTMITLSNYRTVIANNQARYNELYSLMLQVGGKKNMEPAVLAEYQHLLSIKSPRTVSARTSRGKSSVIALPPFAIINTTRVNKDSLFIVQFSNLSYGSSQCFKTEEEAKIFIDYNSTNPNFKYATIIAK